MARSRRALVLLWLGVWCACEAPAPDSYVFVSYNIKGLDYASLGRPGYPAASDV